VLARHVSSRLRDGGSVDFTGRALTLSCAGATLPTPSITVPVMSRSGALPSDIRGMRR